MILNQFDWTKFNKILVCGGREFGHKKEHEYRFVCLVLDAICADYECIYHMPRKDVVIIHGGALGADRCADDWAVVNWAPFKEYQADWNKYGRAAGPIRNQHMYMDSNPDLVVAFPGGKGTENMIQVATAGRTPVIKITPSTKTGIEPMYDFEFINFKDMNETS